MYSFTDNQTSAMLLRNTLLLLLNLFSASYLFGQLEVKTEEPSATYTSQDTAWLLITSNQSGVANFNLRYDRFTAPIQSGTINLISGQINRFPIIYPEPGVIHFQLQQNGSSASVSLIFDPFKIQALNEEPSDFDDFWNAKKNELNNIPIDPRLEQLSQSAYSTTYRINLASVANRRVYGYISIPNGSGPFPAILTLPAFGESANIVQPETTIAEQGGAISMTISIHNAEPDAVDPNAYTPDDITDPNKYYFRWAIQAGLRAIEYLYTRPDFDRKHLGVIGVSQGGALAIMLAGLDSRVNLLAISNPAYCQHSGLTKGRASGFPFLLDYSRTRIGTTVHEAATLNASAYYDAIFFAKRYTGPTFMSMGYRDDICPAATSLAAFNQLKGSKVLVHARDLGHTHPSAYWDGRYDFFRQHFLPCRTPPWPWPSTTTGYLSFAGTDLHLDASSTALLKAQTSINNRQINDWPIVWEKVSGPGLVNFNPKNDYRSVVNFNAVGEYCIRFTAQDKSMLGNTGLFYSLSDALRVTVDGNGQIDTRSPSLRFQTPNTTTNGDFMVNLYFDEPVIGFEKSDLNIINGSISSLNGTGQNYQIRVIPQFPGAVKLSLPAGQVQDRSGNVNIASDTLVIYYSDPSQELLILSGQIQGKRILLNWVTNTDFKNRQFFLQRSSDSITFSTIKTIISERRPAGPTQYQTEDGLALAGRNFYRLLQQEIDGQEKTSNIISVSVDFDTKDLALYPVPASEKIYINLAEHKGKEADLMIFDIKGRMVGEHSYSVLPPETIEMDVSDYDDGLYFLQLSIKGLSRFSQKFTVFKTQE